VNVRPIIYATKKHFFTISSSAKLSILLQEVSWIRCHLDTCAPKDYIFKHQAAKLTAPEPDEYQYEPEE
jgi:hypothetical protein